MQRARTKGPHSERRTSGAQQGPLSTRQGHSTGSPSVGVGHRRAEPSTRQAACRPRSGLGKAPGSAAPERLKQPSRRRLRARELVSGITRSSVRANATVLQLRCLVPSNKISAMLDTQGYTRVNRFSRGRLRVLHGSGPYRGRASRHATCAPSARARCTKERLLRLFELSRRRLLLRPCGRLLLKLC